MAEEKKPDSGWSFAVFWLDKTRPIGMQARRASARNLPREEAEAECARLEAEQPGLGFQVWFDRLLPDDEGVTVEEWAAGQAEPSPQRIEAGSATPEQKPP